MKDSIIAPDTVPSLHWKAKREKLIKEYTTTKNGSFIMNSDKTFSSPSSVADFCIGSSNNGWIVWKDKHGNTFSLQKAIRINESISFTPFL